MIGVDLVYIPEFQARLESGGTALLEKLFNLEEIRSASPEHLSGVWAAKEAVRKTISKAPENWTDIRITYDHNGKPAASYAGHLYEISMRPFLKSERHSFEDLTKRACQAAWYLKDLGVKKGDRVMIVAANSPEWMILFLGAQLVGVAIVPVDARSNAEAAYDYAAQTEPVIIFKNMRLVPELKKNYHIEPIELLIGCIASYPTDWPKQQLTGKETAVIVFTSGTTAAPKGVVLTQQNMLANMWGVRGVVKLPPHWGFVSVLPLSHMFELTASLTLLTYGASVAYLPRVTPITIAQGFKRYRPTGMLVVPELLSVLLSRIRQTAEASGKGQLFAKMLRIAPRLPIPLRRLLFTSVHKEFGGRLQAVVCGGAPVPLETAAAWEAMGVRVVQGYGLTETAPILAVNGLTKRKLDSQGMILPNTKVRIADDGELQAKGPSIFSGYWRNAEETKRVFTTDGWFKTGDIGHIDAGWLHIQGRAKFTIVLPSGLKVFPEDVETAANGEKTLKELCVVGRAGADGERVMAVVVSEQDDVSIGETIKRINTRLQPFQHITEWRRWPDQQFPRNRILKIDRKTVLAWANEAQEHKTAQASVSGAADRVIECIRLSIDKPDIVIKPEDRLADLGLDSLRRLNLVSLIEEQLGRVVEEESITATTTVNQLRQLIAKGAEKKDAVTSRPNWPFAPVVRICGNFMRDTLVRSLMRLWVTQRTIGVDNIPTSGEPVLYMFNHTDNFDGPVAFNSLPRRVRRKLTVAQAADFMQEHRGIAWGARFLYAAFDFARQAPFLPSLEYTADLVDKGWSIAMFPEGSVARTPRMRRFKTGIGLLAVELGIPVVPAKIKGLFGTFPLHAKWPAKRSNVTVIVGKPVRFGREVAYHDATKQLERLMREL